MFFICCSYEVIIRDLRLPRKFLLDVSDEVDSCMFDPHAYFEYFGTFVAEEFRVDTRFGCRSLDLYHHEQRPPTSLGGITFKPCSSVPVQSSAF